MKPTICICCGEPIADHGNALSRNPNICACCSSLADGMDEVSLDQGALGLAAESYAAQINPAKGQSAEVYSGNPAPLISAFLAK
jgi:hypothetical protein